MTYPMWDGADEHNQELGAIAESTHFEPAPQA